MVVRTPVIRLRALRPRDWQTGTCTSCGAKYDESITMHDIKIGSVIVTVCDVCNERLLDVTLKATVDTNGMVKGPREKRIQRLRMEARQKAGKPAYGRSNQV